MLEEQLLDVRHHDRRAFRSGTPELDEYLQRYAVQQGKKGVSLVRVLIDTDAPTTILGYYSLSAAQIDAAQLTTSQSASLAVHGEVKRGSPHTEPKAPLTGGGEAPTARSEFFTERERARLPRYPVPCFRLGRLAVDVSVQGKGMGKILVALAVERCLLAGQNVAAYALVVDAKNARAAAFYRHYGFVACTDQPEILYLPLMPKALSKS